MIPAAGLDLFLVTVVPGAVPAGPRGDVHLDALAGVPLAVVPVHGERPVVGPDTVAAAGHRVLGDNGQRRAERIARRDVDAVAQAGVHLAARHGPGADELDAEVRAGGDGQLDRRDAGAGGRQPDAAVGQREAVDGHVVGRDGDAVALVAAVDRGQLALERDPRGHDDDVPRCRRPWTLARCHPVTAALMPA